MKRVFVFNPDKCCACSACMMGCMDQNDIDLAAGGSCYRKTFDQEIEEADGSNTCVYLSAACMHCTDAPCIDACPAGCLGKDPETGFTVYDNTNCIGCKSCAMACPFGAPRFGRDGRLKKCDGCAQRVKHGMQPACVRVCPFDALKLYREDEYAKADLSASTHRIVNMILAGQ